ncbi:unnamed protein product [Schistosoma turkestanicum]|nr:unnamed protein product [Schistosoma turkestanicum]
MNTAGSLNHTITTTNQNDLETNTLYRRDISDVIFNSINNNRMSNICLNTFIMNSSNSSSLSLNRNTISLNNHNNHNNSNINQFYSNLMPYLFPMDLSLNSVQQQQQNQQLQYYTNDWLTSNNNNSNNNVYHLTLMYFALATQCILRHLLTTSTTQQSQQNLCSNSSIHSNCTSTLSTISTTSQNDLSSQTNEHFSESHTKLSTIHKYIKLDTIKLNGNTRIKRYQCNYPNCTKAYYKRSHLNEHYHLHTGVKPHLCNQPGCGARFTRADQLSRHRRAHTGERNFYCNVCLKRFKRSDHLKVHLTRNVCTKSNL